MRWNHSPIPDAEVAALARHLGTVPIVAELLLRNGLREAEPAAHFLRPALASLADPFLVGNVDRAVARLIQAIERKEAVTILGDYDVDGVSSTALLVGILRRLGLSPRYFVPRRLEEGYGLTRTAIDRALADGPAPALFVALDCGTNSQAEVAHLHALGIDVIIVDHHRSKDGLAQEAVLINPPPVLG